MTFRASIRKQEYRQLEGSRTQDLLRFLKREYGGYWLKVHGGPYQPRTIDIIGCVSSRYIGIEVKNPSKGPTPLQSHHLDEMRKAGAIVGVVWSNDDAKSLLTNYLTNHYDVLDIDSPVTSGIVHASKEEQMPRATAVKDKPVSKSKRKQEEEEEEDDELEDLDDDLDEDDDLDDEDDEDEDEDEDDEPPAKSKGKAKAASTSKTKAKAAAEKPASNRRGNPGNLTPRRVPEGMAGATQIAAELNSDARTVRMHLRKLEIPTNEGVYQWKPNSREFKDVVKKVRTSIAGK